MCTCGAQAWQTPHPHSEHIGTRQWPPAMVHAGFLKVNQSSLLRQAKCGSLVQRMCLGVGACHVL